MIEVEPITTVPSVMLFENFYLQLCHLIATDKVRRNVPGRMILPFCSDDGLSL